MKKILTIVPLALLLIVGIGCNSDTAEISEIKETTTLAVETSTETITEATTETTTVTTTTTETTTVLETTTEAAYSYDNSTAESGYSKTVYIGATGTKYHLESCRTLKGNGTPISLDDAIAQGRTACKVCNP